MWFLVCLERFMRTAPRLGPASPGAGGRRGFTLIEALLAAALAVLLLGAVVAVMAGGLRVWERARAGSSPRLDVLLALEWLQRDLHSSTDARHIPFEGSDQRLRLPVIASVDPASPAAVSLLDVTYGPASGGRSVTRDWRLWPAGEPGGQVALDGIELLRFAYGEGGENWESTWKGRTNRPAAVRVTARLKDSSEIRRTIQIPGATVR